MNRDDTRPFWESVPRLMTTEDLLKALGQYTKRAEESDRRTAAVLGIKEATLRAWLDDKEAPEKVTVARLAGFLRRVGYL